MTSTVRSEPRVGQFVLLFVGVLASLAIAMWRFGFTEIGAYFVVAFLWLLVLGQIYVPPTADADWVRYVQWVKWVCWAVLLYVLFQRVAPVLQ